MPQFCFQTLISVAAVLRVLFCFCNLSLGALVNVFVGDLGVKKNTELVRNYGSCRSRI